MPLVEHKLRSRTRPSLDDPFELDGKMYKVVWSEPVGYVWADGSCTWRLGLHPIEEEKTMDPNETLRRLRRLQEKFQTGGRMENSRDLADEMAELFEALDGWLSKGGFLPDAWKQAPTAEKDPEFCCSKCGGTGVEYAAWIDANTGDVNDHFGSWNAGDNTFCRDCNENTNLIFKGSEPEEFAEARAKVGPPPEPPKPDPDAPCSERAHSVYISSHHSECPTCGQVWRNP